MHKMVRMEYEDAQKITDTLQKYPGSFKRFLSKYLDLKTSTDSVFLKSNVFDLFEHID